MTLPQQLEPFITQENPALEAAMKAGNLPFPDLQGMPVIATKNHEEGFKFVEIDTTSKFPSPLPFRFLRVSTPLSCNK